MKLGRAIRWSMLASVALVGCSENAASVVADALAGGDGRGGGDAAAVGDAARGDAVATRDGGGSGGSPTISGCPVFPPGGAADTDLRAINADISALPRHPDSDAIVARLGNDVELHRDFGTGRNGIPYLVVGADQPLVEVNFTDVGDESDPGPEGWIVANRRTKYPIPADAPVENGDDRHVLVVDPGRCQLFELYAARWNETNQRWNAAGGAVFDLRSGALRPIGWTSADAAGLPILPLLVRYDEVAAGAIEHALRFTVGATREAFILPATHMTSTGNAQDMAPMGMRFRLKASVDISGFSSGNQVILRALKRYGMLVADNGVDWFLSGAPDDRWTEADFLELQRIKGSDFEAVDTGSIRTRY